MPCLLDKCKIGCFGRFFFVVITFLISFRIKNNRSPLYHELFYADFTHTVIKYKLPLLCERHAGTCIAHNSVS